jgi:hypothetical protein
MGTGMMSSLFQASKSRHGKIEQLAAGCLLSTSFSRLAHEKFRDANSSPLRNRNGLSERAQFIQQDRLFWTKLRDLYRLLWDGEERFVAIVAAVDLFRSSSGNFGRVAGGKTQRTCSRGHRGQLSAIEED